MFCLMEAIQVNEMYKVDSGDGRVSIYSVCCSLA